MFSRGFVTAALLILIALLSLAVARRLEREYRLLRKLRAAQPALRAEELSDAERATALDLQADGVLRESAGRLDLDARGYAAFWHRRLRLAVGGGLGAVLLALAIAAVLLRR